MEVNIWGLLFFLALVLSVGGLVEIVPLFFMKNTFEHNRLGSTNPCSRRSSGPRPGLSPS